MSKKNPGVPPESPDCAPLPLPSVSEARFIASCLSCQVRGYRCYQHRISDPVSPEREAIARYAAIRAIQLATSAPESSPCQHSRIDHGICLECGADLLDELANQAHERAEGMDR